VIEQLSAMGKEVRALIGDETKKIALLKELAEEFGVALVKMDSLSKQISGAIGSRLKAQSGMEIYQASSFTLDNFPLAAARKILPAETSKGVWDYSETATVQMMGPLLERWNPSMLGVTRALQTVSESVIRVVASLLGIKITRVLVAGTSKLKIDMMYVLADGTGEVHWPKDAERREIAVSATKEAEIRSQIATDVWRMGEEPKLFMLSPEFLRNQLHDETRALLAEAYIHNSQQQQAQAAPGSRPKKTGKRAAQTFEVQEILEEKRGKYLVRWAGYHPSWEAYRIQGEPGSQLETWEPRKEMLDTQALQQWQMREGG